MTLTQITEKGIKDGEIINADINTNAAIAKSKLETFVNTNADNRVITGSGTANTLNGEADFTYDGDNCIISRGGNSVAGLTVQNTNNSQANAVSQITISGGDNSYAALEIETNSQSHKVFQLNTGHLGIEKSGVERIRLDSTGTVGLNVSSPLSTLHVKTPSTHNGTLRLGGSSADLGFLFEYDQASATTSKIYANPTYTNTGALLKIGVDGDANPNQLVLKGNGLIGIGTSSPATTLHLNTGNIGLPKLRLQHTGSGNDVFEITGGLTGVSNGGFGIYDVDESTYRLVINSVGRVAIGTTNPLASLHIKSPDGSNARLILEQTQDAANYQNGIDFKNAGTQYAGIVAGKDASNNSFGIKFHTTSSFTERMQIKDNGHVKITSGNLEFASGSGIDFSANPDGSRSIGTDGNKFDEYEEGSWTPNSNGGYKAASSGSYTRIGKMVYAAFNIDISSNSDSNHATITGLPFTVEDADPNANGVAKDYQTYDIENGPIYHLGKGQTQIVLYKNNGAALQHQNISGKNLRGTAIYRA